MKRIVIAALVWLLPITVWAQNTVNGKVSDSEGKPVIGAVVQEIGSFQATVTNIEGEFSLAFNQIGDARIQVRSIGFETFELDLTVAETPLELTITLQPATYVAAEFEVTATRAGTRTPVARTDMNKEDIEANNVGLDLPFLLDQTPSVVVTSDAGTGIGYTGIRIRGSDPTRINVTINGIPLNDAESQGTFWVDLPDFASSTDNLQIQRGVGTSTNGAGAFGGTVNLQTNSLKSESYARLSNTIGSFNTIKNTASFGTGLLANHWTFDGRLSRITSDGFIDRATSDLNSYYASAAYVDDKNSLRVNVFSGKEVTYQAWGGVPSDSLAAGNRTYNPYTYENEVDDYVQTHSQLLYTRRLSSSLTLNSNLHITRGLGFFEQFRTQDDLADYNIAPEVINDSTLSTSDLIRRRWLDNYFYGATWSLMYKNSGPLQVVFGGAANRYDGKHFGEVIWAQYAGTSEIRHRYYDNDATKRDISAYLKANYQLNNQINLFGDLQYRGINYEFLGKDANGNDVDQEVDLAFFNPKAGIYFDINSAQRAFASVSMSNKEPNRNDYTESSPTSRPDHESLIDYELGYQFSSRKIRLSSNLYYMDYTDQLVLTGQINDVGAATRTNIADSYRAGIEIDGGIQLFPKLRLTATFTYSQNKIESFTEYVDDWDNGGQIALEHTDTDIAFSPNMIGSSTLAWSPFADSKIEAKGHQLELALVSKYVGEQFIDNTSNNANVLDPYLVNDVRLTYSLSGIGIEKVQVIAMARNVLDEEYESNAWIYRYSSGGQFEFLDGYYPQAGRNFMVGLNIDF